MAVKMFSWSGFKMCSCFAVLIMCLLIMEAEARPNWTLPDKFFDRTFLESATRCAHDAEILDLCQRCAKATKSNFAYPMCCTNEENAIQWCHDYVYFGIQ